MSFDETHFAIRDVALSTTLSPSSLYVSYVSFADLSSRTSHSGVVAHTRSDSFSCLFGTIADSLTLFTTLNSSISAVVICE